MEPKKTCPQLIICDIDGTLIDRTEAITPHFDELSRLITEHSLQFSIASGRCLDQLQPYIQKLHIESPVIINNGAGARLRQESLWDIWLNPLHVKKAILTADEMNMAIFMCNGNSEVAYRHNAYIQREIDIFGRYNRFHIPLEREWPDLPLEKVMITDPESPGRIDAVLAELQPYANDLTLIRYDARHLDIMRDGVSKGGGVRRLAARMGISLENVMAIGDGENDIEMLQEVGIGVAVNNAKEVLKQQADYICREAYTAGVVEAIRRFCTGPKEA